MLFAQPLVRRDKKDIIERQVVVMQKLSIVDMHYKRLTASGSHPEGKFLEVVLGKLCIFRIARQFLLVALCYEFIQPS